jgi:myo-inositol-1(or 4)-monophosphatase
MKDLDKYLEIAADIAREAGDIVIAGWGNVSQVGYKGEVDLVTEFDKRAETFITGALSEAFPHHVLFAEEQGTIDKGNAPDSPFRWLIDPLDGTTNYAHAFPVFAVSLALTFEGEPVVGVVFDPTRDECFTAVRGKGAALNGKAIHTSDTKDLGAALLGTGFPYDRRTRRDNNTGHFSHFIRRCQGVRRAGCAALDLCYVACGRLDGFWELRLHPWDVSAGLLAVQEVGGRVTDFLGGPEFHSGAEIVASNGRIHDEMLAVLRLGDVID